MLTTLTAALLSVSAGDVAWSETLDAAQARAQEETKVLFVAVHMPGEAANERMAAIYDDKAIEALAERTVNVLAMSMDAYATRGTRVKLGGLGKDQLKRLDIDIRAKVLKPDKDGFVVAPQHVFLRPDGEVILSVPYELSRGELEWCFLEAIRAVDPAAELEPSKDARAPKRLIKSGVIEGSDESIGASPATAEEVSELIKELRKGRGAGRGSMPRLYTADVEEAREYITKLLRGGGKRGDDHKIQVIGNIARRSPASWWTVVVEFADHSNPRVREAVAACLEVLAAPESVKTITKELRKEKDPRVEGTWRRAHASAGAADTKTAKAILKALERAKESPLRANATLALGYLPASEEVHTLLRETLADAAQPLEVRLAAVCALAMTREASFRELYEGLEGDLEAVGQAAQRTLDAGDLVPLGPHVKRACGDTVPRARLFGGN